MAGLLGLAVLFSPACGGGAARTRSQPAKAVTWDEQNRALPYLIIHLSNINVINGLNLTPEQAVRLRALARKVEAASHSARAATAFPRPS